MTGGRMGFWNLHVPCAAEARHFLHPPVPTKEPAAEMVHVLFLLSSDAAALGAWLLFQGPGSCRAQRHWAPQWWGAPGEPLVALFLAFITVTNWHLCPFRGNVQQSSVICLDVPCPRVIPPCSSRHPWKKLSGCSSPLPHPHPQTFMLQFCFWLWFLHGIFFSGDIAIMEMERCQSAL